jgi:hypothetical protein
MNVATAETTVNFVGRGDFTKERHERPELSRAELRARIERIQAEHPERYALTPEQVRGAP